MNKIIFESHATSIDNEKGIASGWLDPSLSEKGVEQAKELGQRYRAESPRIIYVSDLKRSYETAKIAFRHFRHSNCARYKIERVELRAIEWGVSKKN